jgi:DNA-binding GntR family transcriptional regulator
VRGGTGLEANGRAHAGETGGSLADEAYARIRRRIVGCDLAPGEQVTEGQLVETHGIGKTPVREALQRLAQEGLVQPIRRHGYRVAPITLRDVRDLFGLRLIIEPAAAELAVGRIDVAQLRDIQARYTALRQRTPLQPRIPLSQPRIPVRPLARGVDRSVRERRPSPCP